MVGIFIASPDLQRDRSRIIAADCIGRFAAQAVCLAAVPVERGSTFEERPLGTAALTADGAQIYTGETRENPDFTYFDHRYPCHG